MTRETLGECFQEGLECFSLNYFKDIHKLSCRNIGTFLCHIGVHGPTGNPIRVATELHALLQELKPWPTDTHHNQPTPTAIQNLTSTNFGDLTQTVTSQRQTHKNNRPTTPTTHYPTPRTHQKHHINLPDPLITLLPSRCRAFSRHTVTTMINTVESPLIISHESSVCSMRCVKKAL